jgi:hypothetical protein
MMEPSFEKLLVHLADGGVDFILVGDLAVTLQGYVRFTEDVDILLSDDPPNIRRFLEVMGRFGEGFARDLSQDDFADEEGAVRIIEEVEECQLDVFTVMSGRRYSDVLMDADVFEVSGKSIRYASKASLIGWKEKSDREMDRLDAAALRRLMDDPQAFD